MSGHREKAESLFLQGYNCAQSVLGAFAQDLGLDFTLAVRLASGMGGGIGRLRETCGGVSGMVLALSMARGYSDPQDDAGKKALYEQVQTLVGRFREENGSILCRELLGEEGADRLPTPSRRTDAYYEKRPCAAIVASAAGILEDWLDAENAGICEQSE